MIKQYYYKLKDIPMQNIGSGNEKDQIEIEAWLTKNTSSTTKNVDVKTLVSGKIVVVKADCSVVSLDMKYEKEMEVTDAVVR